MDDCGSRRLRGQCLRTGINRVHHLMSMKPSTKRTSKTGLITSAASFSQCRVLHHDAM